MVGVGGMLAAKGVRRLAHRVLGALPPIPLGLRATDAGLDEQVVRGALELSLRISEAMLGLGASAADVTAAIHRTARAFGLLGVQVDVTFTSITVSYDRGGTSVPLTLMRVARVLRPDYDRLGRVMQLSNDIGRERIPFADALDRLGEHHATLDEILAAPHPYGRWFVTFVLAVLAAAVAVLLGGGLPVALVAGATTAVIDRTVYALDRWGLPPFFVQGIGAAIATLVAVGLFVAVPELPVELTDLPPSLVVASGIVVLLAGLSLVGAAEDAISGFPVTAGGRTFEVIVLTLGIVVGIGGVLEIARRRGVSLVMMEATRADVAIAVQIGCAIVIAGAWGVASYARPRAATAAAGAGGLAWIVFAALLDRGVGPAVASAAAALVIGFLSEWLGPRLRVPPIVISVCGIVPLLPGLAIYRALFQLVDAPNSGIAPGLTQLLGAVTIGLGLAAGVTLGEFLAAPLRRGAHPRLQVPAAFLRRSSRPGSASAETQPGSVEAQAEVPRPRTDSDDVAPEIEEAPAAT